MEIVIMPDSFKGSLDAVAVSAAIARGLRQSLPAATLHELPLGDGGENTVAALVGPLNLTAVPVKVVSADGAPVTAAYYRTPDEETAYIQASDVVGYAAFVNAASDPLTRSTYGLGQLLVAARDAGATKIVVALGGSATSDGGLGLLQAVSGQLPATVAVHAGAADLGLVEALPDCREFGATVVGLADVTNPLTGPLGAASVFGPQKGLDEAAIHQIDAELTRLYPPGIAAVAGAGAAGGLGAAIAGPLGGQLTSGIEFVLDALAVDDLLARADLVVTGEGHLDAQSTRGKAISGIMARLAQVGSHAKTVALCGALAPAGVQALGLTAAFTIGRGGESQAAAFAHTAADLERVSAAVGGLIAVPN